ncbi:MAG: hypothetical protein M9894_10575 [Planctomycetes bacterium]|nr:hypothetical protein [Planctomycetota bacterium]
MRPALPLALALLVAGAALAAPDGPPFYDRKRALEAQNEAARAAADEARATSDPARVAALLADDSGLVRDRAFTILADRDDEALLRALVPLLGHRDEFVSAGAAELFAQRRFAGAREALEKVGLASRSELTALETIWALEALGDAASFEALERAFKRRKEPRVRGDALIALAALAPQPARAVVDGALQDAAPPVRIGAIVALRALDPRAAAAAAVDVVAAKPDRRNAAWEPRLLLCALETLRLWPDRAGARELVVRAVDALIERLAREEGLPQHEVNLTLDDLTQAGGLEADPEIWRGWWAPRRDAFQPVDKAPPAPPAPEPRGGRRRAPREGDDAPPAAPARPETGNEGRTRVRFHGVPVRSKRLVFAQDMSGGMNNPLDKEAGPLSKLQFSKDELVRVLEALPDDVRTNVVFFASDYWRHAEQLVPINRARAALIGFVKEAVTPDFRKAQDRHRSRSNIYDPLVFAMEDPEIDTVFFLSEGGPNEGRYVERERLLRHVARLNVYQRVQVHTLQVTNDRAGGAFLRRLAEVTGGQFHDVEALKAARAR